MKNNYQSPNSTANFCGINALHRVTHDGESIEKEDLGVVERNQFTYSTLIDTEKISNEPSVVYSIYH